MIKSREINDPQSCLNRAADDEPLFVLRANDELAAELVRKWATEYWDQKRADDYQKPHTADEVGRINAKHDEALRIADEMETWRNQQVIDRLEETG